MSHENDFGSLECPICQCFMPSFFICPKCKRKWKFTGDAEFPLISKPRRVRLVKPIMIGANLDDCIHPIEKEDDIMLLITISVNSNILYKITAVNRTEALGKGNYGEGIQQYKVEIENCADYLVDDSTFVSIQHPWGDLPGLVKKMIELMAVKAD